MKAKTSLHRFLPFLGLALWSASSAFAQVNPKLLSSVPDNGATGVAPDTSVVFTFSKSMDTDVTSSVFIDPTAPFEPIVAVENWTANTTVLTVTFPSALGSDKTIVWTIDGADLEGNVLDPTPFGTFHTGGGGNANTNSITRFVIGKVHFYDQTNSTAPTLDLEAPYAFQAITSFASNRTATTVILNLPTGSTRPLSPLIFGAPEDWFYIDFTNNLAVFDATYPAGNYVFALTGSNPNDPIMMALPADMAQPNPPNINNLPALQSIDPTKPVTITWQPFQGGTSSDFISVDVTGDSGIVFQTPFLGEPGALPGTAASVTMPANSLSTNKTYNATVGFYHGTFSTNILDSRAVYRATVTEFEIKTSSGGQTGDLRLLTPVISGSTITLQVSNTTAGQMITLETSSTLQPGSWVTKETKTAAGNQVTFTDTIQAGKAVLYRARTGS